MDLRRSTAEVALLFLVQLGLCTLLRGPMGLGPPPAVAQPQRQWVQAAELQGALRFYAKFDAPVEAHLILYEKGNEQTPLLQTPYLRALPQYFYLVVVDLPKQDLPEAYTYQWEARPTQPSAATPLAQQIEDRRAAKPHNL